MDKEKTIEIRVPFGGFYESIAGAAVDDLAFGEWPDRPDAVDESELTDAQAEAFDDYKSENYKRFQKEIATRYVTNLFEEIRSATGVHVKPFMKSIMVDSPMYYNFTTDRIFLNTPKARMLELYEKVNKEKLAEVVKDLFTSRPGFSSYYDAQLQEWGDPENWDHNQWAAVIQTIMEDNDINEENLIWNY